MIPVIAQIIGFLPSVLCPICSFLPRRTQILLISMLANLCSATNLLLLGNPSSSAICFVAVGQTLINYLLERTKHPSPAWLNAIFMPLYIGASLLTFGSALDLLPMAGALLFLVSAAMPKVVLMRLFSLGNCICWITYDAIVGSSLIFSQLISLSTLLYALSRHFWQFLKQRKEETV